MSFQLLTREIFSSQGAAGVMLSWLPAGMGCQWWWAVLACWGSVSSAHRVQNFCHRKKLCSESVIQVCWGESSPGCLILCVWGSWLRSPIISCCSTETSCTSGVFTVNQIKCTKTQSCLTHVKSIPKSSVYHAFVNLSISLNHCSVSQVERLYPASCAWRWYGD